MCVCVCVCVCVLLYSCCWHVTFVDVHYIQYLNCTFSSMCITVLELA